MAQALDLLDGKAKLRTLGGPSVCLGSGPLICTDHSHGVLVMDQGGPWIYIYTWTHSAAPEVQTMPIIIKPPSASES